MLESDADAAMRIYAEEHRPPQFHIVGPDFQVVVRIADLTVIAGTARRRQIDAAMAWPAENREMLAQKEAELVERE